jgi:hypothetical protein
MQVKLIITSKTKPTKMRKIESDYNSQGLAKLLITIKGEGWTMASNGRTSCSVLAPSGSVWSFMDQD